MISMLTLFLLQASAPTLPTDTIVVTASLPQLAAAVDRCARGGCTAREDVVASIRLGEALFRRGDYGGARKALKASLSRTRGAAAEEPIAISQLQLAIANVAAHHGDQADLVRATYGSVQVLREQRPGSGQTLLAEMRVGDMLTRVGRYGEADRQYQRVVAQARSDAFLPLRDGATLRLAWIRHLRGDDQAAKGILGQLIREAGEARPATRLSAQVIAARLARDRGDPKPTEQLLAQVARQQSGEAPHLIYVPPMPRPGDPVARDRTALLFDTQTRSSDFIGTRWVDIGFWIRGDGRVEGVEALRGSRTLGWAAPLVAAIGQRRYAPLVEELGEGQFRIERYTLTADFDTPVGSLIRRRVANARFEQMDLTEAAPAT